MAARTIVTLHPDVECDVCGRRLLRGERPDVFLGGGQRRMVCELCTPRAAHEGWRREVEDQTAPSRTQRPQRGRSLLGRLRQLREPARGAAAGSTADPVEEGRAESAHGVVAHGPRRVRAHARTAGRPKLEPEWTALEEEWTDRDERPARNDSAEAATGKEVPVIDDPPSAEAPVAGARSALEPPLDAPEAPVDGAADDHDVLRALEIFNGGATPRRIASVARALGEASVHVTREAQRESVVGIVVAWELCWYRYELDLEDPTGEVQIAAEGTELEELPAALRVANAVADEHGTLALLAV